MQFCCERLKFFIKENRLSIFYRPKHRRFSIGMKSATVTTQSINFCPWCGKAFPDNLRDQWLYILRKEFKISYIFDDENKIPAEFKTDQWWIERGL